MASTLVQLCGSTKQAADQFQKKCNKRQKELFDCLERKGMCRSMEMAGEAYLLMRLLQKHRVSIDKLLDELTYHKLCSQDTYSDDSEAAVELKPIGRNITIETLPSDNTESSLFKDVQTTERFKNTEVVVDNVSLLLDGDLETNPANDTHDEWINNKEDSLLTQKRCFDAIDGGVASTPTAKEFLIQSVGRGKRIDPPDAKVRGFQSICRPMQKYAEFKASSKHLPEEDQDNTESSLGEVVQMTETVKDTEVCVDNLSLILDEDLETNPADETYAELSNKPKDSLLTDNRRFNAIDDGITLPATKEFPIQSIRRAKGYDPPDAKVHGIQSIHRPMQKCAEFKTSSKRLPKENERSFSICRQTEETAIEYNSILLENTNEHIDATTDEVDHPDDVCSPGVTVTLTNDDIGTVVISVAEEADLRVSRRVQLLADKAGRNVLLGKYRQSIPLEEMHYRLASAMHAYAVVVLRWFTGIPIGKGQPFRYAEKLRRRKAGSLQQKVAGLCQPYKAAFRNALQCFKTEWKKLDRLELKEVIDHAIETAYQQPIGSQRYYRNKLAVQYSETAAEPIGNNTTIETLLAENTESSLVEGMQTIEGFKVTEDVENISLLLDIDLETNPADETHDQLSNKPTDRQLTQKRLFNNNDYRISPSAPRARLIQNICRQTKGNSPLAAKVRRIQSPSRRTETRAMDIDLLENNANEQFDGITDQVVVIPVDHPDDVCSPGVTATPTYDDIGTMVIAVAEHADLRVSRRVQLLAETAGRNALRRQTPGEKRQSIPSEGRHHRLAFALHTYAVIVLRWFTGGATGKATPFRYAEPMRRPTNFELQEQVAALSQPYKAAFRDALQCFEAEWKKLNSSELKETIDHAIDLGYKRSMSSL